ncbi:hypothetical protein NQ318_019208 [Aromia moschata]|uniref:Uncharacterized protein n=1 Tax=Aromia moschata TaxID=1265417 RepID=A0AAV8YXY9_9CUCU|nr:hypothetical protein NQ318_019208 [Aromia moschata]
MLSKAGRTERIPEYTYSGGCTTAVVILLTDTGLLQSNQSRDRRLVLSKLRQALSHTKRKFKVEVQVEYNGEYFQQHEGTAIGNSLSPFIANLFMSKFETEVKDKFEYFHTVWFSQTEQSTGLSSELRMGKVSPDRVMFKLVTTRSQRSGSSISSSLDMELGKCTAMLKKVLRFLGGVQKALKCDFNSEGLQLEGLKNFGENVPLRSLKVDSIERPNMDAQLKSDAPTMSLDMELAKCTAMLKKVLRFLGGVQKALKCDFNSEGLRLEGLKNFGENIGQKVSEIGKKTSKKQVVHICPTAPERVKD